MTIFRKKPREVDAFRLGYDIIPTWFEKAIESGDIDSCTNPHSSHASIRINKERPLSDIYAHSGDWIILGLRDQIYARSNKIFRESYEKV